jgi:hypothetical protein
MVSKENGRLNVGEKRLWRKIELDMKNNNKASNIVIQKTAKVVEILGSSCVYRQL